MRTDNTRDRTDDVAAVAPHIRMSIRQFLHSRLDCNSSEDLVSLTFASMDEVLASEDHVEFAINVLSEIGINVGGY